MHARSLLPVALLVVPPRSAAGQAPVLDSSPPRWSLHAQATVILQGHGHFPSPYAGRNSFLDIGEVRTSLTVTLFAEARLWPDGLLVLDPEVSGGAGVGNVFGVAGFPNGEITRVTSVTPKLYVARLFVRQRFGRLTLTLGKLSATDVFDDNAYAHDPRTQFMNWGLMANGAWDYPADTRGYTWGGALESGFGSLVLRLGSFMEPRDANGLPLDSHIGRAHGDVLEVERRFTVSGRAGHARALVYANHAHMGSYRETLDTPADSMDVTRSRAYRVKHGLALSADQELSGALGALVRLGWNDGKTESWAFAEIDRTASLGLNLKGTAWARRDDDVGVAVLLDGLSRDHRDYLAAGGYGFMLGDGKLGYASERIVEAYYAFRPRRLFAASLDYQWVVHPGYNRDRGPVSIWSARLHWEL